MYSNFYEEEDEEDRRTARLNARAFEEFKQKLRNRGANNSQVESNVSQICYQIITENADLPFNLMREKLVAVTDAIDDKYKQIEEQLKALSGAEKNIKEIQHSLSEMKSPTESLKSDNGRDMMTIFSYILQLGKDYKVSPDVSMRCASYAAWALCNTGVPIPKEIEQEIRTKGDR